MQRNRRVFGHRDGGDRSDRYFQQQQYSGDDHGETGNSVHGEHHARRRRGVWIAADFPSGYHRKRDAWMHQFFAGHHLPDRSEHNHAEWERNGSRDRGEYVLHRGGAGPDARTISARNARRIRSAAGSVVFGFVRCNLENEIATAMGHICCGADPGDRRNVGLRQLAEIAGRTSYAAGKLSAGGDGNGAERLNLERESDADGGAVARQPPGPSSVTGWPYFGLTLRFSGPAATVSDRGTLFSLRRDCSRKPPSIAW